ncbi:MAG: hypothetical protein BGO43_05150 [Gammaproteobacteria bacterium 39-13]|nr:outer membrane protein transport protein [Gammaproteobacteria bacterium]OJV96237.1 MAG: hypothetical protein BGO43_05150 [Gammaproteobacteria bacterium 39-13]
MSKILPSFKIFPLIASVAFTFKVQAGGIFLYELGTDDVGLAAAGYSARAQDPSTIYTNPAGMTRLKGRQLLLGAEVYYEDIELTISNANEGTDNGGNPVDIFAGGSIFYSHSINDAFKSGLGIYGNFGSLLRYHGDWAGRYSAVKGTLIGTSIQPTLAYRFNNGLSIGGGPIFMYGILRSKTRVNNSPFQIIDFADGEISLSDKEWGYGANLGVLFEFNECTRIGLDYTSQIKLNFSPNAEFTNLNPILNALLTNRGLVNAEVDIGIKVPQTWMGSIFHQMTERWAILASGGWQEWSKFGQVDVGIDSTNPVSITVDRHYKNTWHAAIGLQHQYTSNILLNAGVGYDSRLQDTTNIPVSLPVNSAWRFGVGTKFNAMKCLDLGAAFEYIYGGDLHTNSHGPVKGDLIGVYESVAVYFLSFNAVFKYN